MYLLFWIGGCCSVSFPALLTACSKGLHTLGTHRWEREGEMGGGEVGGTNGELHRQRAARTGCETPVGEPAAYAFQPPVRRRAWTRSSGWQRFTEKASSELTSCVPRSVRARNVQQTLK